MVFALELGSAATVAGALVELELWRSCLAGAEVLVLVAMVGQGLGRGEGEELERAGLFVS